MAATGNDKDSEKAYVLDEQAGFLLRLAYQRHISIFTERMTGGLTPTQFSTLFRLREVRGPVSQNALGRMAGMDAATTKGVVTRLIARGLIRLEKDGEDKRRHLLSTTQAGRDLLDELVPQMRAITEATLAPLSPEEQATFLALLKRLI